MTSKRFYFLLLPEFSAMCLFNSIEPLNAANRFGNGDDFECLLVSIDGKPVKGSNGLSMDVSCPLKDAIQDPDISALFVMASYNYRQYIDIPLIRQLRTIRHRSMLIGGMDTGSYALAKAGLLNGYKATIHWAELDTFKETFPTIDVTEDRYVIDRNRVTSPGASSSLDLSMALIRQFLGTPVAVAVSELMVFDREQSGSTPQRSRAPSILENHSPRLAKAIRVMEDNIEKPLTISEIAKQVSISQRQLERDFQLRLNTTASKYYLRLKIRKAQNLISETSLSLLDISVRCGFSSYPSFVNAYKALFDKSPSKSRNK